MDQRRSRMHRTPTGKHLAISSRDIDIFKALSRYRYLRSTYLHAFCGGASETRFKERLGDLFHEGYLDRPLRQWQFADARHLPAIHELNDRSRTILDELGLPREPGTFLSDSAHRQFAHSVLICECLASFELAARSRSNLRFIPCLHTLAKAPEETKRSDAPFRLPHRCGTIVPDGFFGLEYCLGKGQKAYRFFALEVDRGTMPIIRSEKNQTSLVGKLSAYCDFIADAGHKHHLGVPNLLVLTITTAEQRVNEVLRDLAARGDNAVLLFKAIPPRTLVTPSSRLLCEAWARPNLEPLPIDH